MRIPHGFLIFLAAAPAVANAQQHMAVAVATASDDTTFHDRLAARFWTHLDASAGWQHGQTSFASVKGLYCPVLATLEPEAPLYLIGGVDSLQVDDTPLPRGAVPDSLITSTSHKWHTLDLVAIKGRFKGC